MPKRTVCCAALLAAVALVPILAVAGFDADTVAFYPFTDKAVGETAATGDVITNAVAAGTYDGAVKLLGSTSKGYGTLTFGEFPWPCVYSDAQCTNLLTRNVQAIHISTNRATSSRSAAVIITTLAEALRTAGGDYTIEFFWKDNFDFADYYTAFYESIGRGHSLRFGYETPHNSIRLNWDAAVSYGAKICDGYWHHLALIHDGSAQKTWFYGDYTLRLATPTDDSAGSAAATCAIVLGSDSSAVTTTDCYGYPDIELACVRVTKRKLEPPDFLRAYGAPKEEFPVGTAFFHWSMTGSDGAAMGVVSNLDNGVYPPMGQYLYAKATNAKCVNSDTSAGSTNPPPAYCVDTDSACPILRTGPRVFSYGNDSSAKLCCSLAGSWGMSGGYGFQCPTNAALSTDGSFTLEAFVRLDLPGWQTKVIDENVKKGTTRWRLTIFSRMMPYCDSGIWKDSHSYGAFSLQASPGSSGNTSFTLNYMYYDGEGVPQHAGGSALDDRMKYTYYMANTDFGARFHHFAVVYDQDALKLRLYIDYKLRREVSLVGPLALNHSPMWEFGMGSNNGALDGWFDEIRLSTEVLQPSQFLKMRPKPRSCVFQVR